MHYILTYYINQLGGAEDEMDVIDEPRYDMREMSPLTQLRESTY